MIKHISFPSIERLVGLVVTIDKSYNFMGLDAQDQPIFDENKLKPILSFEGTIKLHGTNASICYNDIDGMWCQSREQIITPKNDNAGFAMFVEEKKNQMKGLIDLIVIRYSTSNDWLSQNTVSIFFEWVGKGVQKKASVGVNNLPKSAFIIGVKISPHNEEKPAYWVDFSILRGNNHRIYNIRDFKKYQITIDFNKPEESVNQLNQWVEEIEKECPVAKELGFSGVGEGIVFTNIQPNGSRIMFKAKGEKHSKNKAPRESSPEDDERTTKVNVIANEVTPGWRLEQAYDKIFIEDFDKTKIGTYIKAVLDDIVKEDLHIIAAAGLSLKDVQSTVSTIARSFLFNDVKCLN